MHSTKKVTKPKTKVVRKSIVKNLYLPNSKIQLDDD